MIPSAPSKILVGISLDPDHSIELLSWATRVLAQSNDTIVAIHVRVGEETCQSKQINLEARVGFSSDIARALIEEAKSISDDYLLLRGSRNRSNRTWHDIIRYCFEHAPETCTVLSLGKCEPQKNSANIRENLQPSSRWLNGNRIFLNKEKKQSTLLKCFTYEEIASATNNFHPDNIVGRGGYSEVYRGDLSDGRTIAVKMLAKDNRDAYKEKEFLMELGIIGHVCHPNTANLLGCCVENGLYLIFNFSQNGNLASALRGKTGESLQWPVRYKIALGVARGLHYLHKCSKHRI
ncbi:hypothetical protein OIU79_012095 [Salix purpurea]|uniref:Protein kinase domain-containing protein n=1 Tax=Salix purpurea TaxID=77065 RepID=A0A9Q0Q2Z9_SALPP|nr:hypothetical protein OIU79_012095 [Salix purpurea]